MKGSFLCYIEGSGARWQGVCIDFDLTVFGASVDEVMAKLSHVVHSYIADALMEDEPHRSRLLARQSPWHVRAYWRAHVAWTQLRHKLGSMAAVTTIRLPAPPSAPCPV